MAMCKNVMTTLLSLIEKEMKRRIEHSYFEEESELGFAAPPSTFSDKSYVNMYLHHDGYPEWQGVQWANWIHSNARQDGSAIAAKLVHDHYYDSCYLYPDPQNIDHQYTYVIWTGKDDIWISCYDQYNSKCVFVLKPEKIISKYMEDMEYTDFANGETRNQKQYHVYASDSPKNT